MSVCSLEWMCCYKKDSVLQNNVKKQLFIELSLRVCIQEKHNQCKTINEQMALWVPFVLVNQKQCSSTFHWTESIRPVTESPSDSLTEQEVRLFSVMSSISQWGKFCVNTITGLLSILLFDEIHLQ